MFSATLFIRRRISIITAVIAEFNPLHIGHSALLQTVKEQSSACVVIMSGNFTQRGSPALADKFTRAHTALLAGADLVLELPFRFACSPAKDFAKGALRVAALTGLADILAFGMEDTHADLAELIRAEHSDQFTLALRHQLSLGASFPKAYSLALDNVLPGSGVFISKPNNLLALSYVREIITNNYSLGTLKVKRTGSVSSRQIRDNFPDSAHLLPESSQQLITDAHTNGRTASERKLWPLIQAALNRSTPEQLRDIYGITEGIENRILKLWPRANSLDDFMGRCVCSRYTRSQIRRKLVYILLGLRKSDTLPQKKIRVLAMNSLGRELIKGKTLFCTRGSELGDELSLRTTRLWELCTDKPDFLQDFRAPVIM